MPLIALAKVSQAALIQGFARPGGWLEGGYYRHPPGGSQWFPACNRYDRMGDLIEPPPTQLWVFVDEPVNSINDAFMLPWVDNREMSCDLPASYHNGACGFCCADGHAEGHKWLEASTRVMVIKSMHFGDYPTRSQYRDVDWMNAHSTAKRPVR